MSWRNLIWILIVAGLAGLSLYLARRQPVRIQPHDPAVDQLSGAIGAYKTIQQHSYHQLAANQANRGAIQGLIQQVDEYSVYVPPEKEAPLSRRLEGELDEIGLRIARQDGRLVTLGALPGSPAHAAGLGGGLEIQTINGTEAAYLTLAEARRILESPGRVALRLRTFDAEQVARTLESARFEIPTVAGIARYDSGKWLHVLDEKEQICYIRVSEFVRRTPDELQAVYRRLEDPRGLVLDLRGNPGGGLPYAVEVADRFLTEGLIVRVVGRDGEDRAHPAHADGTYPPVPLVALIDSGTASAAEIVAGALQAHGRATLVGQESHGKWCVQSLVPLGYGLGEAYLTTAEYFLPPPPPTTRPGTQPTAPSRPDSAGPATQPGKGPRGGLRPDVPVRLTVAAYEQLETLRLQAMVQPSGPLATTLPDRLNRAENLKRSILAADAQLARAVQILRQKRQPATAPSRPAASAPAGASAAAEPSPP